MKCLAGTLACATILFVAAPARAVAEILIAKSENVRLVRNFWYHPMETSNDTLLAFTEREDVRLPDGRFPVQVLNRWDKLDLAADLVVEGATVDSHMLYFHKEGGGERLKLVAEIEFDRPIVGLIADCELFERDAALFAPQPTHKKTLVYDKQGKLARWSLEEEASWTPLDRVTLLSPTRLRVEFTNHSATDPLRVLTLRSGKGTSPYVVEDADATEDADTSAE